MEKEGDIQNGGDCAGSWSVNLYTWENTADVSRRYFDMTPEIRNGGATADVRC
jgi:hypothetical protein